jgi:hypothetical protein
MNNFDFDELNKWFAWYRKCWYCDEFHADAYHHILGRTGKYHNSILNAAPVNNFECHINIHGKLKNKENKIKLLSKTLNYLVDNGYAFNKTDLCFILKNKTYYEKILTV